YQLGAKQIVCLSLEQTSANGYVRLGDGSIVSEGDLAFLELRPVRWLYDEANRLLVSCMALFAGLDRDQAAAYLTGDFLPELTARDEGEEPAADGAFRVGAHDELSLIRAFVEADIPLFLHGLSGDGKSDRVRQVDPQALDIELVNETPETINGRAIYNEAKNEIVDVKPVWLVKLEQLCQDGQLHILFFDELTNATKQTQSVIFKIVLERFVNNRWPLPPTARIVAAGNDRSESSAAHDLAEPLFGRFAHLYIRTTVENWMPWAVRSRINPYVLEFLANNDLYLRTPFTGTAGHADPRRWEMVSKALDASGNDLALLEPIVGRDTAETFIRFFKAQQQLAALGTYTDEELSRFGVARRYQLAQQCLYLAAARPEEARALVTRLGPEFLAWFEYVLKRKEQL
ncbi:MAG: ATP-binding protein, partial [Oscillospiraceae bacterium]|nr:ATP-binding protein [Oscillospiraceae bacterium]